MTAPKGPPPSLMALWDAGYEWVCVDMFDTLVARSVHPEDVKRFACERLARTAAPGMDGTGLYQLRASEERRLCEQNRVAGYDPEFSLEACLESLASQIDGLDESGRRDLVRLGLDIEIATECSVQQLDAEVAAFVRSRPPGGPHLALVSDFYLPATALRRLLQHHGLEHQFQAVFSSADDLISKRSGRRYPALIEALGCPPERIVMVGDNLMTDVDQARSNDLAAYHVDRSVRHGSYAVMARTSGDLKRTARDVDAILHADQGAIFPELALTLYCFTERLHDALQADRVQEVIFLSREGQPLKSLYDAYRARRDPAAIAPLNSRYLEASRRSLFLPSLDQLTNERFDRLFRQYRRISWGDFLRSLSLDALIEELRPVVGTDAEVRIDDLPTSAELERLVGAPRFQDYYEQERLARRSAFVSYLHDLRTAPAAGALTIVDVGWKGTMQDNLVQLLAADTDGHPPQVAGLYVGLVAPGAASPSSTKRGLLFSGIKGRSPWFDVFDQNRSLFEMVLAADHASTRAYGLDAAGLGIPIRGEYPERPMIEDCILPVLGRIMDTFQRLDELLVSRLYSPRWLLQLAARHHARMVFSASEREIDWFTQLHHVENFGVFEQSSFGYPPLPSLRAQMRFAASLLRRDGRDHLGFWPWLRCRQQGGRPVGAAYGFSKRLRAAAGTR